MKKNFRLFKKKIKRKGQKIFIIATRQLLKKHFLQDCFLLLFILYCGYTICTQKDVQIILTIHPQETRDLNFFPLN